MTTTIIRPGTPNYIVRDDGRLHIVGPYHVGFDDPGLYTDGVYLFTPAVGTWILDFFIAVLAPFDDGGGQYEANLTFLSDGGVDDVAVDFYGNVQEIHGPGTNSGAVAEVGTLLKGNVTSFLTSRDGGAYRKQVLVAAETSVRAKISNVVQATVGSIDIYFVTANPEIA